MRFDRSTTIHRDGRDIDISVEFDATPFVSATYWQPAEGGEIEILAVYDGATAIDPPLTDAEESQVLDHLYESLSDADFDDGGPDPDDWRDRRIDDALTGGDA